MAILGFLTFTAEGASFYIVPNDLGGPSGEAAFANSKLNVNLTYLNTITSPGSNPGIYSNDGAVRENTGGASPFSVVFHYTGGKALTATISWNLTGTGFQMGAIVLKGASSPGSFPYGIYNPSPTEFLQSEGSFTAQVDAGADKNILHVSFFGAPASFDQVIIFGDSLSDDGNMAHRARDTVGLSYPGIAFDYSNYRFTDDSNTLPASSLYRGTWHEQLAGFFLSVPPASNSLEGDAGYDYAFGGASTRDGTQQRTIVNNPTPFGGGKYSLIVDNMGKQIDDYLATHPGADANALYVLWGGSNDLFDNDSAQSVTDTANRVGALIQRLAHGGARKFLVPNVPPLGAVPNSLGNPATEAALDLASANYRGQLATVLASTQDALAAGGVAIQVYSLDAWLELVRVLSEPSKYGFVDTVDSAQGNVAVDPDQYLFWDDIHPTTAGHHEIASQANRLLKGQVAPTARAANISTRGLTAPGERVLIGGFIISGSAPKKVIVRGLGPSLSRQGVSGALADPVLTIFDGNHVPIATNDNWKSSQQAEIEASHLAPSNDLEAAIIITLPPGGYSATVSGVNNTTGVALAEVFDLDSAADSRFLNLSTRGFVGTNDNVLIGGLIVASGGPVLTVLRAIGPSLSSAGITQPLLDPILELHDANGALLVTNDDWNNSTPTAVKATLLQPSDARESVIVASLAPGAYSTVVRGKNNTTGVALVEAFRIE